MIGIIKSQLIFLVALLCFFGGANFSSACQSGQKIGDLNGDGNINNTDVSLENSLSLGQSPLPQILFCADTNQDGLINSTDVQNVTNASLGSLDLGVYTEKLKAVAMSPTEVKLTWGKSSRSDFTKYVIVRASVVDGSSWVTVQESIEDVNTTSFIDRNLTLGVAYQYLFAVNNWPMYEPSHDYAKIMTPQIASDENIVNKNGAIVFAYVQGEQMPVDGVDTICENASVVPVWYAQEADKYDIDLNMSFDCLKNQISLPGEYWNVTDNSFQFLDSVGVINYLKTQNPVLNSYDFIAVNYYVPNDYAIPVMNFSISDASSGIIFIGTKKAAGGYYYYPFDSDDRQETFAHELAHTLGALDKYSQISGIDCLLDPRTGYQYNGYDIMCHRVDGAFPLFNELVISPETAREIGWYLPESVVATPVASIGSGTFDQIQNISLSTTTEGAQMYYTIDGSTPTSLSTQYQNPISITQSKTLKAIAIKSNMTGSHVLMQNYVLNIDSMAPASPSNLRVQ